jgi:cation:H+ antiporter
LIKGSVNIAKFFGVSDLVVGLTIVAAGTSLPELASAIASARRKEHEFVLGNIIGSNIFNTLTVVGVAVSISPIVPEDGVRGFS